MITKYHLNEATSKLALYNPSQIPETKPLYSSINLNVVLPFHDVSSRQALFLNNFLNMMDMSSNH